MIPEVKKTAVEHALQTAFEISKIDDIRELTIGLSSALILRIVVKGKPYLLRIIMRTDAMGDPTHYYNCMKPATEAGYAPHVWYAGVDDGISITDFIEAKPFPLSEARVKLPVLLRGVHSLPAFPNRINYLDIMNGVVIRFHEAKILPENIMAEILRQYERIKKVYPRNPEDMVSCHNDLKPENILFDGEQAWLVDWEAAFLNDRYLDLAIVANFVVMNDDDEKEYLKIYFGQEANEYQNARFFLMRQMLHLFYFTFFLKIYATEGEKIDLDIPPPDFREFHDRMWAGGINLANGDAKQQYARVHMEQLIRNLKQERFEKSLQIVADH